jgi:predicted lipid-binding transport protein (Tim44 family)
MGLVKTIFGTIFGLIGGIFSAIGGLVGLGKKSEFYMELDESSGGSQPAIAPSAPAPAAKAEPALAATPAAAPTQSQEPKAPAAAVAPAGPAPTGFASNYLTSVGTSLPRRRRPGPSLSPFRDMAKQVSAR